MAIVLKIARSHQEIDDALWVRHEALILEDSGSANALPDGRLIDRFDVFPRVINIIAYDGHVPVATMRLSAETAFGLPTEEHFDFTEFRKAAHRELIEHKRQLSNVFADPDVVLGSAGMLAIRKAWQSRTDIMRAMFKMSAGISLSNGFTHIVAAASERQVEFYQRLGFTKLNLERRSEEPTEPLVALATSVEAFYDWAFADLPNTPLSIFKDSFERLFLPAGETVFHEDEYGDYAYMIDSGHVQISRRSPEGPELTLAHLQRGDLFGELALIDERSRSATAVALTDVELITLRREMFMRQLIEHPSRIKDILEIFTERIRRMDELALILAFAPAGQRLEFALNLIRDRATPDEKHPRQAVASGGPAELARSAGVDESAAERYLLECRDKGELSYTGEQIRFLDYGGS